MHDAIKVLLHNTVQYASLIVSDNSDFIIIWKSKHVSGEDSFFYIASKPKCFTVQRRTKTQRKEKKERNLKLKKKESIKTQICP